MLLRECVVLHVCRLLLYTLLWWWDRLDVMLLLSLLYLWLLLLWQVTDRLLLWMHVCMYLWLLEMWQEASWLLLWLVLWVCLCLRLVLHIVAEVAWCHRRGCREGRWADHRTLVASVARHVTMITVVAAGCRPGPCRRL